MKDRMRKRCGVTFLTIFPQILEHKKLVTDQRINQLTDQRMHQQMDRQTDTSSYTDAWMHLKSQQHITVFHYAKCLTIGS